MLLCFMLRLEEEDQYQFDVCPSVLELYLAALVACSCLCSSKPQKQT